MPIALQELVEDIIPEKTVLIFGAGASVPSGAPSVRDLISKISNKFHIDMSDLTLREISSLAERKKNRRELVELLRESFKGLSAKGSILNLPLYNWKSLFTTNYDTIIEESFAKSKRKIQTIASNFDFNSCMDPSSCKLFKIHGTINQDIIDGHNTRIILTNLDYDLTQDYREVLWNRIQYEIEPGTQVIIIGNSLADEDLRNAIQIAIDKNQKAMSGGKIAIMLYTVDENRAQIYEMRGLKVAFGSLDDFFRILSNKSPDFILAPEPTDSLLAVEPSLRPVTISVDEEVDPTKANASAIFNGWPATYPDIIRGFTFDRNITTELANFLSDPEMLCAVLLGGSGVGKTTAARQVLLRLRNQGVVAWEHKTDHFFQAKNWLSIAQSLGDSDKTGVLMVDESHLYLHEINELIDLLVATNGKSLKLLLVSNRNHWGPRVKTPNIYAHGKEFVLSQLDTQEIERLLAVVETTRELWELVESGFGGFSPHEKRRRLIDRCEADMFVCMKNIFASEKFDDIILREYGTLASEHQDIYRLVSAMESAGIRVHRQLVMRILGVKAEVIPSVLAALTDIINEYDVSRKEGVYGWKVRHEVIAGIISKFKFYDLNKKIQLFEKVIENTSPSYGFEVMSFNAICSSSSGLSIIPDKNIQNVLLRKMMSIAPGERVPRHRLIRNLIELGEFEQAETEIRIFEKDFKKEGPVVRYKILLMVARASHTQGILVEDRLVILNQAKEIANSGIQHFPGNKYILGAFCDVGIEHFRLTGEYAIFDEAMLQLQRAETALGDPDISKMIVRYQRQISGQAQMKHSLSVEIPE